MLKSNFIEIRRMVMKEISLCVMTRALDERLTCADTFDVNLTKLDPVIYSGMYHSIGNLLGRIGDYYK